MVAASTLDLLITIAYFSIPAQILVSLYKYPRLQKMPCKMLILLILFSLFILCCGAGHCLRFLGLADTSYFHVTNTLTAAVSLATALYLLPLVPHLFDTLDRSLHSEVAQSQQKLATFMGFLCHEVRNPLFVITSSTQFLQDKENMTDGEKSMVEAIDSSAKLMLRLVNDVLDIAKIDAGKLELDRRDFDMKNLLQSLECNTRIQMGQRHKDKIAMVNLVFEVDPSLPTFVYGDSIRLLQIFYNLLSNAAKFTEKGEIRFKAALCPPGTAVKAGVKLPEAEAQGARKTASSKLNDDKFSMDLLLQAEEGNADGPEREVQVLKVTVSDSGVGIEQDRLKTIFQAYTQAKLSDYRNHGGTGLGLAIVANLVKEMGGTVSVESKPGKGTSFQVLLPLPVSHDQHEFLVGSVGALSESDYVTSSSDADFDSMIQKVSSSSRPLEDFLHHRRSSSGSIVLPDSSTVQSDSSSACIRVLVTDDNAINRRIMGKMLGFYKIEYDLAVNGQDAIDKFTKSRNMTGDLTAPFYSLVFMDLHMPIVDGYAAIKTIRSLDKRIPIVALTANALSEERTRAIDLGANEFRTKPLLREDLRGCCQRLSIAEQ